MKNIILFATPYPYTTAILAIIWIGSAILMGISDSLALGTVLLVNVCLSFVISVIGFRK